MSTSMTSFEKAAIFSLAEVVPRLVHVVNCYEHIPGMYTQLDKILGEMDKLFRGPPSNPVEVTAEEVACQFRILQAQCLDSLLAPHL